MAVLLNQLKVDFRNCENWTTTISYRGIEVPEMGYPLSSIPRIDGDTYYSVRSDFLILATKPGVDLDNIALNWLTTCFNIHVQQVVARIASEHIFYACLITKCTFENIESKKALRQENFLTQT